ncbi:hypothetical protein Bpfe_023165, partial [Biomphalaria pfeifferi]
MFVDKQEREEKTTNDQDWSSKDKTCVHSTTVKLLFHLVLVLLVTIVIFALLLLQQKVSRKNTAVTFPTAFDKQLYQNINTSENPNCVLYEQTFPEKWCVFRTIEFLKQ